MTHGAINIGFLVQGKVYSEALMLSLSTSKHLDVTQRCYSVDHPAEDIGKNTDVLICDAGIDSLLALVERLCSLTKSPRIVILLHAIDDGVLRNYISSGVHGFLCANHGLDQLMKCVTEVHAGNFFYPSAITERLVNSLTRQCPLNTHIRDQTYLTPRQDMVIKLMESGCSNKDIARSLNIEVATVKNHVHQILDKLNAKSRCEAVAYYRRRVEGRQPWA